MIPAIIFVITEDTIQAIAGLANHAENEEQAILYYFESNYSSWNWGYLCQFSTPSVK